MIQFSKYHGTGNDFILINGEKNQPDLRDEEWIRRCCDRRYGIGADGMIIVRHHGTTDFEMLYFNADGRPGSFCGNGSRCAVRFAREEGFFSGSECVFTAYDGVHMGRIGEDGEEISVKMSAVGSVEKGEGFTFLDTGSPHYVEQVLNVDRMNVTEAGRAIRYSPRFASEGVNVNFVEKMKDGTLKVATYERGVEEETLSCGTGVVAGVLGFFYAEPVSVKERHEVIAQTRGGELTVKFVRDEAGFSDIWLTGPAEFVFSGRLRGSTSRTAGS